jgi:hypothetical protein
MHCLFIVTTVGLLLCEAFVSTDAFAQSDLTATVTPSPSVASPVAKTPPLSELAASDANRRALAAPRQHIEQPRHRLPNSGLTSAPDRATLDSLRKSEGPAVETLSVGAAPPSSPRIKGFVGITDGINNSLGFSLEPPDQGLAINNNVAVEIVNNAVMVFDATTGAILSGPIATSVFFNAPAGTDLSDTQVFFDPTTQRWFLTELIFNNPGHSGTINDIAVAVSETSSATGSYFIYQLRAFSNDVSGCGGIDCFADYPKAGYDANIFVIDVNLFNNQTPTGAFVAAAGYVIPKSVAATGGSFTPQRIVFGADAFVVQPSIPAPGEPFVSAANGTEYLMEAFTANSLRVWAISNTNNIVSNPSSLRANAVTITSENYVGSTVPSRQPNVIGPYCSSVGATSAPSLDGGYSAFQATIQMAGAKLYGALAYGATDDNGLARNNIAWFVVTPSVDSNGVPSASIPNQGFLAAANGYSLSYPAFGLDKTGAGYMGITQTNQSADVVAGFPSASIIQFTGMGFTGGFIVTGQGFTSDDGFTGCAGPGPAGVGRWGDYGAAVVDAVTGYFYTANEMIPNPSQYPRATDANWGTFITQIAPTSTSRITNSHDYNGDGISDIAWRDGSGNVALWLMNPAMVVSQGSFGGVSATWSIVGQRDFNGDGKYDLLWRDTNGNTAMWFMNGTQVLSSVSVGNISTAWSVIATGDFNGDGMGDILWQDGSSRVVVWLMNGATVSASQGLGIVPTAAFTLLGTGDFDGDGKTDLLWRDSSGNVSIWFMNGTQVKSASVFGNVPSIWSVVRMGDFNGDGMSDILWRDNAGNTAIWLMNGTTVLSSVGLGNVPTTWSVPVTGDYNGDGKSDILWRDGSGNTAIWFINGTAVASSTSLGNIPTTWTVQSLNAE